jgi:hypothetical protein
VNKSSRVAEVGASGQIEVSGVVDFDLQQVGQALAAVSDVRVR